MDQAEDRRTEAQWFGEEVMDLLPDLLGAARRMTRDQSEAEDVVADAVARGWERRDQLRDRSQIRGWLFRIVRNCHLSRQRARRARPPEIFLSEHDDPEASFSLFDRVHQPFLLWWGSSEEVFLDRLVKEDFEKAVESLPEEYRLPVVLADVQQFKYAEIAEALDIPVGTVRSRLARGRARLQKLLWDHAVDAGLRAPESAVDRTDRADGEGP